MSSLVMIAVDLVAISVLAFPLYFRRHRRRDLATAFVVLNVAVLSVAAILGTVEIGLGVGMGLFGVLSIIRLRSSEISQAEIAYYFSSLSIGLIAGLSVTDPSLSVALIALILATVALVDSRHLLSSSRRRKMKIAGAFTSDDAARERVEALLGHPVGSVTITNTDFIGDTTTVDVRWKGRDAAKAATAPPIAPEAGWQAPSAADIQGMQGARERAPQHGSNVPVSGSLVAGS